ncbi:MAG: P1 family peptidase, partial [Gemmatimonadales bacterium]
MRLVVTAFSIFPALAGLPAQQPARPRVRDVGVVVGLFRPGANNAITDVAGVTVGHATVVQGDSIRTGVTAIIPH